jgi:ubiquitin carboxyl-terminal hydrolase 9/24
LFEFVQERRGHSLTNRNKNRWFKFNDTTVEEFEMTDEKMMNECFGGSYKVQ